MNTLPDKNAKKRKRQKLAEKITLPFLLILMALPPAMVLITVLTRGVSASFDEYGMLWGITLIEFHLCVKLLWKTSSRKKEKDKMMKEEIPEQNQKFFVLAPLLIFISCLAFIGMIVFGINPFFAILVRFYGSYFSIHLI